MVGKSNLKNDAKVQTLKAALDMATRSEEKRQVLGEIARVNHVEALKVVEPALADEALKREAQLAYFQIAESLIGGQPAIAKEALEKIVATTTDNGLKEKALAAIAKIK